MTHWKPLAFDVIQQKAHMLQHIRAFFLQHQVLEVSTPLLSKSTVTDPNIESIAVIENDKIKYLQTSPEFFMKRLLAAGSGSIYQIAHAFRAEEQGNQHVSEFSLLEWYMLDWDYQQLMLQMTELIKVLSGKELDIPIFTYSEIFKRYLDINPLKVNKAELQQHIPKNLLQVLDVDAQLDYCLSMIIFPKLKDVGWFFIKDYPSSQASLAKIKQSDSRVAERFELFYNGMELANGFSELQDVNEQRQRFEADNLKRINRNQKPMPLDEALLSALESGLPKCSGVALGLERLMMVLFEQQNIQAVGLE